MWFREMPTHGESRRYDATFARLPRDACPSPVPLVGHFLSRLPFSEPLQQIRDARSSPVRLLRHRRKRGEAPDEPLGAVTGVPAGVPGDVPVPPPRALPPPRARRRRTCPASADTAGPPWKRRATAGNTPRSTRARTASQPPASRPCRWRTRSRRRRRRPFGYPRRMRWRAVWGLAPLAPLAPRLESRPRLCDAWPAESGCRTQPVWRDGKGRRRNRIPRRRGRRLSRAPRPLRFGRRSFPRRFPRRTRSRRSPLRSRGKRPRRPSTRDSPRAPPRRPRTRCPSSRRASAPAGARGRTPPGRGRVCTPEWRGTSTPGGGTRPARGWRTRGSRPRRHVTRWRGRAEDPAARRSVEKHTARWSRVPGVSVPRRCR